MVLGLGKISIGRRSAAPRVSLTSSSIAMLASLTLAACAPAGEDDAIRSSNPHSVNAGGAPDAAAPGGGASWPLEAGAPFVDAALPGGGSSGGGVTGGVSGGGLTGGGGLIAPQNGGATGSMAICSRDIAAHMVDRFFLALKAHDTSSLPFTASTKFTENGRQLKLGEGIWKTAGATTFKHSAYDIQTCTSVTEAVIAEGTTEIPIGVRLKFEPPQTGHTPSQAQPILEVEVIAARSGSYPAPSDTGAIVASGGEMWEQLVTASQRASRAQLEKLVDDYFALYPTGACYFSPNCLRFENGFAAGSCTQGLSCAPGMPRAAKPRLTVVDVEAGIAVGFQMASNGYTHFHMFLVRGGEVRGVHAILASATASGW